MLFYINYNCINILHFPSTPSLFYFHFLFSFFLAGLIKALCSLKSCLWSFICYFDRSSYDEPSFIMLHVLPQEICTLIFCGCQCNVEVPSCSLLCSCKPEVIWGPNTTICISPWHFESLQYICGKICSCSYFHVHFVKRRFPLKCLFLFLKKV